MSRACFQPLSNHFVGKRESFILIRKKNDNFCVNASSNIYAHTRKRNTTKYSQEVYLTGSERVKLASFIPSHEPCRPTENEMLTWSVSLEWNAQQPPGFFECTATNVCIVVPVEIQKQFTTAHIKTSSSFEMFNIYLYSYGLFSDSFCQVSCTRNSKYYCPTPVISAVGLRIMSLGEHVLTGETLTHSVIERTAYYKTFLLSFLLLVFQTSSIHIKNKEAPY